MHKFYTNLLFILFVFFSLAHVKAQEKYEEQKNISYYEDNKDSYIQEKCKLDVYYPTDKKDYTTVVWFHGGGLTGGAKEIPDYLKNKGIAVVGAGYRLSPNATVEEIIQDAAQSIKWVYDNITKYGGAKNRIVLSGHSAGGYLAIMVALNKRYLAEKGMDADEIFAVVPFSGQMITHFTSRQEKGIHINQPTVDEYAPLYWVRKDAPPITLITGDRELEMVGRYEENAYMARMLKIVEHPATKLLELDGYDHGMVYPALPLLINEIRRLEKQK